MRYLVTGGAGFLGSRICRQLLQDGDDVVAYDVAPGNALVELLGEEAAQRIFVRGDITDGLKLLGVARERGVDAIVHVAALLTAATTANPRLAVQVNCGGTINVLETARILGLRRVAWASSMAISSGYGDRAPLSADGPYWPNSVYGGTKLLCELLAEEYRRAAGVDSIGIRISVLVGAAQHGGFSGIVQRELVEKPLRGLRGRVPYGDDTAYWLWVEDAARAFVLAARAGPTRTHVFNIGGDARPVREAVEIVRRLIPGAEIEVEPGGRGYLYRPVDTTAIEEELGFQVRWRLEDQFQEMVNQARARMAGGGVAHGRSV